MHLFRKILILLTLLARAWFVLMGVMVLCTNSFAQSQPPAVERPVASPVVDAPQKGTPDFERELRWRNEILPSLVVGDPVDLMVGGRQVLALLAKGKPELPAIVLVHGVGVHPDHGLIGVLRANLNDMGYTTLSIQMPVLAKEVSEAAQYAAVFSHSTARLVEAANYLVREKLNNSGIVLLSHSMGSWMSNVYLQETPSVPYLAWVCLSITGRIGSTGEHRLPILDVQAENDLDPVKRGSWLRAIKVLSHPGSKRVEIAGTNHFYEKQEPALVKEIDLFLKSMPKK